MAGGRPTDYKGEETLNKAIEYIDSCRDTVDEKGKLQVNLVKAEGLAMALDVTRKTLYEWADTWPEFSDILDKVNKKQANTVINKALSGEYNANIAKLLLGKHGYHDKVDTDITTKGKEINVTDPKSLALAQRYEEELKKGM